MGALWNVLTFGSLTLNLHSSTRWCQSRNFWYQALPLFSEQHWKAGSGLACEAKCRPLKVWHGLTRQFALQWGYVWFTYIHTRAGGQKCIWQNVFEVLIEWQMSLFGGMDTPTKYCTVSISSVNHLFRRHSTGIRRQPALPELWRSEQVTVYNWLCSQNINFVGAMAKVEYLVNLIPQFHAWCSL